MVAAAFLLAPRWVSPALSFTDRCPRFPARSPMVRLSRSRSGGAPESGDAVLHSVWASWCPTGDADYHNIDAVAQDAPVLAVVMQSGAGAEVRRFLAARDRWPTLVDAEAPLARRLGVDAVLPLIFVDRGRQVRVVTQGCTSAFRVRLRLWVVGAPTQLSCASFQRNALRSWRALASFCSAATTAFSRPATRS